MRLLRGFGQFWYDFIIGDDWKVAAAVVGVLVLGVVILLSGAVTGSALAVLLAAALLGAFAAIVLIDVSRGSS